MVRSGTFLKLFKVNFTKMSKLKSAILPKSSKMSAGILSRFWQKSQKIDFFVQKVQNDQKVKNANCS